MTQEKLQIIVELIKQGNLAGATAELEKLGSTSEASDKKTKDATEGMTGFGKAVVGSAAKYAAWTFIITEGLKVSKESIQAYQQAEAAVNQLNGSLRAAGQYSQEYSDDLRELADTMQSELKIDNKDILGSASILTQFGAVRDEMPRFLEDVANMKAAGVDMNTAATAIGSALQGQFGPIQRILKIDFPEGTTRAEKLAQSLQLLEQRFGGLAKATSGGIGGLSDLKIELGNLKEDFGKFLLTGIEPYVKQLTEGIRVLRGALAPEPSEQERNLLAQLAAQRGELQSIVDTRRANNQLSKEEADAMDELIGKGGNAVQVYEALNKVRKALIDNTSVTGMKAALDPSRFLDPEVVKQELEMLQKYSELQKAAGAIQFPHISTESNLKDIEKQKNFSFGMLDLMGVASELEIAKMRESAHHEYVMGLAQLATEGKSVVDEIGTYSMNAHERETEAIRLHFRERRELVEAYYKFEIEQASGNAQAQRDLREQLSADLVALKKKEDQATSESFQLFQQVGQAAMRNFSSGISSAFVDFVRGTKDAKEAFQEFASSFLAQLAQMILEQIIFNALRQSALGQWMGFSNGGVAAPGGVRMAASGGMFGEVSSPTFFPKFNVVAGEAGSEIMAVLSRPRVENFNGFAAHVGNVGSRRMALVDAGALPRFAADGLITGAQGQTQAGARAGGTIQILVGLTPDVKAEIIQSSVAGAVVRVEQDMKSHTSMNAAVKQAVGGV